MKKTLGLIATFGIVTSANAETSFSWKGDFRYRTESIKNEQTPPTEDTTRLRQRMRLRFGATATVNESTDVTLRLATGSTATSNTNSTNQDFTDYNSKKGINVDLAYAQHKVSDSLTMWLGKSPLAFYTAGGNDLVFDTDVTPEGISAKYKNSNDEFDFLFNTSATWLNERFNTTDASDADIGLLAAQIGGTFKSEDFFTGLTLSNYSYSNIKGSAATVAGGNSTVGANYEKEFEILAAGLELGTNSLGAPLIIYGEASQNTKADDYKSAWNAGLKYGKLKDLDSWAISSDYREVQKDAVIGVLTDSDSSDGGADIRSHRTTFGYQWLENATISASFYQGFKTVSIDKKKYQRIMLDFGYSF